MDLHGLVAFAPDIDLQRREASPPQGDAVGVEFSLEWIHEWMFRKRKQVAADSEAATSYLMIHEANMGSTVFHFA